MNNQKTPLLDFPFAEFLHTWWYTPFTIWRKTFENFYHPQVFLGCNIHDLDDEYRVLNEVGSYGKQISKIQKALDVLVAHPPPHLTDEERHALREYRDYTGRVAAVLAKHRGPGPTELTTGYVDRLRAALEKKRNDDPEEFHRVWEKLKLMVEQDEESTTTR